MSSMLFCRHAFVLLLILKATSRAYNSSSCGISEVQIEARILGGTPSKLNQWPWITAIFLRHQTNRSTSFLQCGGALISDLYVLTAAHCVTKINTTTIIRPSDFFVRLGELNIESNQDGANPVGFKVKNVYKHPNYKPSNSITRTFGLNDIALLKLDKKATFSKSIRPICLPTVDMIKDTFEGKKSYVAGWGNTKYNGPINLALLHVQILVQSNNVCQTTYRPYNKLRVTYIINKTHLCAGDKLGGKDSCQGDSGGPLNYLLNNKWYSIGLFSENVQCGETGYPGLYSRTTEFMDWITKTVGLK